MADVQARPARVQASTHKIWMAILLALGLGAVGVFWWLRVEPLRSVAQNGGRESTLALETFVVNLNGSGPRAYLRIGITLGLGRELPRNQPEATPTALVRDTILSVLATAQPDALLDVEGKRQLKDELLKALQERVPQMAVENVYFTEFLVQK
jgi:flagellar basal body-associated protein FliL